MLCGDRVREVGLRFHPTRGRCRCHEGRGPPDSVMRDNILAESEVAVAAHHDPPRAMVRIALALAPFNSRPTMRRRSSWPSASTCGCTPTAEDPDETATASSATGAAHRAPEDWLGHDRLGRTALPRGGDRPPGAWHRRRPLPQLNMMIGGGGRPVAERGAGVPVGLGCDGSSTDCARCGSRPGARCCSPASGAPTSLTARALSSRPGSAAACRSASWACWSGCGG